MKNFLFFIAGAIIGAAGGIVLAKKKIEDDAYEYYESEIEEYKRHVRDDILEADNLERHDKLVAAKAVNDFIAEHDIDCPFVDEGTPFDMNSNSSDKTAEKAEEIIKAKKYYQDEDFDQSDEDDNEDDNENFLKIFEVTDEEADEYECEKNYECIYYTWKKGSSQLIYSGHEFIDITDVLEDYATTFIEGVHNVGEVVNIVNEELGHLYVITVAKG